MLDFWIFGEGQTNKNYLGFSYFFSLLEAHKRTSLLHFFFPTTNRPHAALIRNPGGVLPVQSQRRGQVERHRRASSISLFFVSIRVIGFFSLLSRERERIRGLYSRPAANSREKTRAINEKFSRRARLKRDFLSLFECSLKEARANERRDAPRSRFFFFFALIRAFLGVFSQKKRPRADDEILSSLLLFLHTHRLWRNRSRARIRPRRLSR